MNQRIQLKCAQWQQQQQRQHQRPQHHRQILWCVLINSRKNNSSSKDPTIHTNQMANCWIIYPHATIAVQNLVVIQIWAVKVSSNQWIYFPKMKKNTIQIKSDHLNRFIKLSQNLQWISIFTTFWAIRSQSEFIIYSLDLLFI